MSSEFSQIQLQAIELLKQAADSKAKYLDITIIYEISEADIYADVDGKRVFIKRLDQESSHYLCKVIFNTMLNQIDKTFVPQKIQYGNLNQQFLPVNVYRIEVSTSPLHNSNHNPEACLGISFIFKFYYTEAEYKNSIHYFTPLNL